MSIKLVESRTLLVDESAKSGKHVLRANQVKTFLNDTTIKLKELSNGRFTCNANGQHSFFIVPEKFGCIFKLDFEFGLDMGREGEEPAFGAIMRYNDFMNTTDKPLYESGVLVFDADKKIQGDEKDKAFEAIRTRLGQLPSYITLSKIIDQQIGESYLGEANLFSRTASNIKNAFKGIGDHARRAASGIQTGAEATAVGAEKAVKFLKDTYSEAVQMQLMKNMVDEFRTMANVKGLRYDFKKIDKQPEIINVEGQEVKFVTIHYTVSFITTNGNYVFGMGFGEDLKNENALRVTKIYDFMNPNGTNVDAVPAFEDMTRTVQCMFTALGLKAPQDLEGDELQKPGENPEDQQGEESDNQDNPEDADAEEHEDADADDASGDNALLTKLSARKSKNVTPAEKSALQQIIKINPDLAELFKNESIKKPKYSRKLQEKLKKQTLFEDFNDFNKDKFQKLWNATKNLNTVETLQYHSALAKYYICLIFDIKSDNEYEGKTKAINSRLVNLLINNKGFTPFVLKAAQVYYANNDKEFPNPVWFDTLQKLGTDTIKNCISGYDSDKQSLYAFIYSKPFWSAKMSADEYYKVVSKLSNKVSNCTKDSDFIATDEAGKTIVGQQIYSQTENQTYGPARAYADVQNLEAECGWAESKPNRPVDDSLKNASADQIKTAFEKIKTTKNMSVSDVFNFIADTFETNSNIDKTLPDDAKTAIVDAISKIITPKQKK